jgi:basic amino acid/polyamine antiporter, APA family
LFSLHWYTWLAFSGWVAVVLTFYLAWGRRHSALNSVVD